MHFYPSLLYGMKSHYLPKCCRFFAHCEATQSPPTPPTHPAHSGCMVMGRILGGVCFVIERGLSHTPPPFPPSPTSPLQKHPIRGRANLWIKKMRQSEDAKSVVTELTNHRAQQGGSHIWSRQSEQAIFLLFKKKRKSVTYSLFLDWILTKIS